MITSFQPVRKTIYFLTFALFLVQAHSAYAQTVSEYHQRADLLLENYLVKYWDGNYIRNTGEWTYIHGMEAVIDGAERTQKQKYYGLIETFYEAQNSRRWINDYFDDENWFVLTLIHAYEVTGENKYLVKAKEIYADIQNNAWDSTCCGAMPGGLWWNKQHTQKATAANAGAVISGLKLYRLTNDKAYYKFAKRVYNYWWDNMVDKNTYQVADHINTDGTKVWWKFTYNEGLMMGAALEMYKASGNRNHLRRAHNIANFMVNNETVTTSYGKVLSDGNASQCGGDCHQFKGPGYRYLMELYLFDKSKTAYYDVLKASVNSLWDQARTSDNSIGVDWTGPVTGPFNDRTQNAAAQAMSLFALQNGVYPGSGIPEGQYEAENATIKGILIENSQAGFSGWGFLGGWLGSGKFVKFIVNNPTAGNKKVTLRYAGDAGDAYRNIIVNGVMVTDLKFPHTGGWNVYSEVSFDYVFPEGTSTVVVDYNSNYINLDHLRIEPSQTLARLAIPEKLEVAGVNVYPNPVRSVGQLKVTLNSEGHSDAKIQIVDFSLNPIFNNKYSLQKGSNELNLPVSNLKSGIYFLYIDKGGTREIKKIIIEN
ncbi:MAG TPA: glycoside hydrolase family 76 protein [Cytophagales bacterium]|nr:glycoside hydrolase family 76 protein [Cytophagales bacterium]